MIIDANAKWLGLFGFPREAALGKVIGQRMWKQADDRKRVVRDLKQYGFFQDREIHFRKANDEDFLALTSAHIAELNGKRVIISSLIDITDHKRMEAALRELSATLEQSTCPIVVAAGEFNHIAGPFCTCPVRSVCLHSHQYPLSGGEVRRSSLRATRDAGWNYSVSNDFSKDLLFRDVIPGKKRP